MAIYKVVGSYEEFFEANIEADNEEKAIQIFYQNSQDAKRVDGNWVDIRVDDTFESEEELEKTMDEHIDFTMDNYEEEGFKIAV